jgi:sec-independent protein translocase protein TatC
MSHQPSMTLWQHIGELRKRIIYILLFFVASTILGFAISENVIHFLKVQPEAEIINMVVIHLSDAFKVYVQFSVALGIVLTSPFALYQIWAFVSPGLTDKERKMTLAFIPGMILLFLIGLSFGYFMLFPTIVQFMLAISERLGAQEMYGMIQYFSFLFKLIIPFGFVFQLPLFVLFLTKLGVISPTQLRKTRKYAYLVLVILAAFLTPPDLFSHILVSLPLIALYEVSIWLSKLSYKDTTVSDLEKTEETHS